MQRVMKHSGGYTLNPFVHDYIIMRHGTGTYSDKSRVAVTSRLRSLAEHFGRRPLNQFTQRAIEAWLVDLDTLCANSKSSYLASIRQFTAWLTARGVVPVDPCVNVPTIARIQGVPRAQRRADVQATLAACHNDRDRAIVWLMVGLGLRRMEVAGLCWEHYDDNRAIVTVTGKLGKERVLPVNAAVAGALATIRTRATGPVIVNRWGQGMNPESIGFIVARAMKDAGIKRAPYDGVSAHALRHTAASDVLDQCGDLRVVQQMLGHEHLSTTAIYLRRASAESIRAAMEGRDYSTEVA